ncbi:hemagglutinin [Candidatus Synechococcus calcipolaris G9]|uniref:Hemagglutinin n=1 Tax=Candidatus Synechococcus calcipolaris G9 TaxID=1497997 RepID=A0ABT6EZQ7_9SYNE|nr:hemagglutinin [Candidatus Synechococcus calcipolaris]MDG2991058.1 hemagglutinin [Candidatus Synechococcus calcipolaris G9]
MSEQITASEAKQIMDLLQSMDKKLDVHIAETKGQFNTVHTEIKALNDKVDGLRSELRDDITELRGQQKTTDARLWGFIVALVTLVGSGVIKVLWFDRA